jgi:isopenicillin N synthase-like dioxygenase
MVSFTKNAAWTLGWGGATAHCEPTDLGGLMGNTASASLNGWRDPVAGCEIPILDLSAYLSGEDGAQQTLATKLRQALEEIGFFYVINHGLPKALIDRTFFETARFHALPFDNKNVLAINRDNVGYMGSGGEASRTSEHHSGEIKPDVGEAFFMLRDRAPSPIRIKNQWPKNLPGFRETLVEYFESAEAMFRCMLPIFATSLDLPPTYFNDAFGEHKTLSMLRVAHFEAGTEFDENQFNLAPHTDSTFITLLPTTEVPGLELLGPSGEWFGAPPIPNSILFNSGDLMSRWTNGRFLSTPHRVTNRSGRDRYSIPMFIHPNADFMIHCLPTCTDSNNPPKEPPISSGDYLAWYMDKNFRHAATDWITP